MPELQWDELDFLECLEAIPEVEEPWKTRYVYKIDKDELILTVVIRPLENYVWFSLQQKDRDSQLIELAVFVRGKVIYINDKRGEYLRFENCFIAPSSYSHLVADKFLENEPQSWTIELSIKPQIQIRYLD